MATTPFLPSLPTEELWMEQEDYDREKSMQGGYATERRSPSKSSKQMFRWERAPKTKQRSTTALICGWTVEHQLSIAINILSLLLLLHATFPEARYYTRKFIHLSYRNESTGKYAHGRDDAMFICSWIFLLTGLRAGVIDYILTPLAVWAGIEKKKARDRFAEQVWVLCYHGTSWFCGTYVWSHSAYWLNPRALWWDFPTREIDGLTKYYYLVAFAFWLQQLAVVNIEERRKDHLVMFTHHMITCVLMYGSYCYHQTKVGNVFLCLMDVVDVFLSLAKILKYLKFRLVCDIAFGAFIVAWFVARHLSYLGVCWSIYMQLPEEVNYGCYQGAASDLQGPFPVPNDYDHLVQPFFNPRGLVCWNAGIGQVFLGVLLALQGILLIWLSMIVKVAYKVISGEGADDVRSDDEISEADEKESEDAIDRIHLCTEPRHCVQSANPPIEKEVDFDEMRILPSRLGRTSPVRRSARKSDSSAAATTGVSLRGSSNRKELLGRIGCDKGS